MQTKKLAEAYPDDYDGMFDDSSEDYEDIETTTDERWLQRLR